MCINLKLFHKSTMTLKRFILIRLITNLEISKTIYALFSWGGCVFHEVAVRWNGFIRISSQHIMKQTE